MTAGSVAAPQIIPIRMPPPGKAKHEIDSCTAVEIKSESSDVSVLYTLDGSKPEMMKRPGFGDRTLKYTEAIRLPVGKVSVRAMAVSTDGRQSAVVTKVFIVAPSPSDEQDLTPGHEDDNLMNGRPINGKDVSFEPILNRSADGESLLKNLTSTQISRVQRETDFLRCPKCLSHRPSDPFARFCLHCGAPVPPIPGQRLPPTEGGQMGLCVHCKTMVPLNTATCVVCESPLTQQLQPQASLRLQDKLICHSCGTGNPAHITHCVTCESQLLHGQRAAPVPSSQGKMVSCSKCNRVNHSDARFCDWCGAKPGHKASSVTCSQCGASSHPYANYCGGCGVFLDGPPRTPSHVNQGQDAQEADQSSATWQAVPAPESTTVPPAAGLRMCADAQTQTVGLFFPSSSELKKRSQQREAELSRQEQMSDRKPLLTAVSPGRGYWRKQLDHICAHLRSYTQNNTEFRALIGEPRLGRVRPLSRALKIIIVNIFILLYIISYIIIYYYSLLLKEVGPEGRGQISAVQQLLDEGADPACLGSDGRPALVAAALNGHHDVIPVLVQREADVNQASGPLNNTALHEAAALGNQGLRSVEILLGCNASIRKQNNRGQTAYDIAVAAGSSSAVSLMAAHMGQELLQHHTKARSPSGLDTFS
uniref:Double zinc ribbon and ankyrin repeat-containing protein 1 n=1 Tax=Sinocyclocheilus anshuiensis TaxID=1608454 RepID=A0A671N174_9TELE